MARCILLAFQRYGTYEKRDLGCTSKTEYMVIALFSRIGHTDLVLTQER